jgi:hypothetical protein
MIKLDYTTICTQDEPFKTLVNALITHMTNARTSLQEDVTRLKEELTQLKQQPFNIKDVAAQCAENERILLELIDDGYKRLFKFKELHSAMKKADNTTMQELLPEVEAHMSLIDGTIKRYLQLKNNMVKFEGLPQEDVDKRLDGYKKAIAGRAEMLEKELGVAQTAIVEYTHKLEELNKLVTA